MNEEPVATGWYYAKTDVPGGQQLGPLSWDQLHSLARSGILAPTDLVWNPQLPQWIPAAEVQGLFPPPALTGFPGTYPGAAASGPVPGAAQWQTPPPGPQYRPLPAHYGSAKSGAPSWLAWVIPLVALVIAGLGLGLFFGLRGDDNGGPVASTVSKVTTTTATTEATSTTATEMSATTTSVAPAATTTTVAVPSAVWTALNPGGSLPPARTSHSMVYDPESDKAILFGGWNASAIYHDTWAYDPAADTWTELSPAGNLPVARIGHGMTYHSAKGVIVVFGGYDSIADTQLGDTWVYDPAANSWIEQYPAGEVPAAREGHSLVYDPATGKVILFGGWNADGNLSDTWAYDLVANIWTNLSPAGEVPSGRDQHSMVYDSGTGTMILFGGWDEEQSFNDTWAYDPAANTWAEVSPAGTTPSKRAVHETIFDPVTQTVILFGGFDGENELNDTWAYDPAANTWTEISPSGSLPDGRGGHTLIYDEAGGRIILFGGLDESEEVDFGDIWAYGG